MVHIPTNKSEFPRLLDSCHRQPKLCLLLISNICLDYSFNFTRFSFHFFKVDFFFNKANYFRTLYNEGNQNLEDPSIAPLKWQNELFEPGRKLTIGYYDSDGSFEPHPGCKRVVQEAVAILEKQGHTLIKVGGHVSFKKY